MDNFTAINEGVPFRDVVTKYIGPIRRGFIHCPAHSEKTPSCKVYAHRIHCFGCGYRADAIRIVSDALNVKPLEAAKILNTEYHIGLDLENPDNKKIAAFLGGKERKAKEREKKLAELRYEIDYAWCMVWINEELSNLAKNIWDKIEAECEVQFYRERMSELEWEVDHERE